MPVGFNRTPLNLRVPLFYAEVNSGLSYFSGNSKLMLFGQKIPQGVAASDTVTFTGQPTAAQILTLGGTVVTFVSTTPVGNQVQIGGTLALTLAALQAFLATSGDPQISLCTYQVSPTILTIVYKVAGTAGNAFTVSTNVTGATAATGTLTGGSGVPGGSAAVNVPVQCTGNPQSMFGAGSMLADMVYAARRNNPFGDIWATPLADPAGVNATTTVTIAGGVTPGTLVLYITGVKIQVPVLATDTATSIAANLVTAINAGYVNTNGVGQAFPFSAANTAGVITLTARHVGTMGNFVPVDKDLVGDEGPLAALITIAPGVSGTGVPSLASAFAALGTEEYDYLAMPYSDGTSTNASTALLSDTGGRWDPTVGIFGHMLSISKGSVSTLTALGATLNDQHLSIMGYIDSPTTPWVWAAALGGQVQLHKNLGADLSQAGEISRPMQTLPLAGVLPSKTRTNDFAKSDRNTLYNNGIAGWYRGPGGTVVIERVVTTYQQNPYFQKDTTWLDIETLSQTAYAVRFMRLMITQKHPRDALVPDNPLGLQGFTTPTVLKSDIIHAYKQLCDYGIMKNPQIFADNLIVEQASDPNRVNAYLPYDVANQLRIFAANAETALNRAAA